MLTTRQNTTQQNTTQQNTTRMLEEFITPHVILEIVRMEQTVVLPPAAVAA